MAKCDYKYPMMTCSGVDEPVEHVWKKYYNEPPGPVKDHLFMELSDHNLFYPCPRLAAELRSERLARGYRPYVNAPTSHENPQPGQTLVNYVVVEQFDHLEWNPKTGKMEQVTYYVDMNHLCSWIKEHFLKEDVRKSTWFALWKFLEYHHLLKDKEIKLFARQMIEWFSGVLNPEKEDMDDCIAALAKNIRIYHHVFGSIPFDKWKDEDSRAKIMTAIHSSKSNGISEKGFLAIEQKIFYMNSNFQPRFIADKNSDSDY